MGKLDYSKMDLPSLYLLASERGVKGSFFGKNIKEMAKLLEESDAKDVEENEKTSHSKKGAKVATKKKSKKKVKTDEELLEEDDDTIDIDIDDEEEEPAPAIKTKRVDEDEPEDDDLEEDEPEEDDEPEGDKFDEMERKELIKYIKENELDISLKKSKSEDDYREEIRAAEASEDEPEEDEEEDDEPAPKKKKSSKKEAPKKEKPAKKKSSTGVKRIEKDPNKTDAPFQEGTAGYFCFIAATKGGSISKIAERADKLIEKNDAKPPSNTTAKVKIIMQEVNNGKRGDGWGKFVISDGGKVTYEE
jgi:hypothetical protein